MPHALSQFVFKELFFPCWLKRLVGNRERINLMHSGKGKLKGLDLLTGGQRIKGRHSVKPPANYINIGALHITYFFRIHSPFFSDSFSACMQRLYKFPQFSTFCEYIKHIFSRYILRGGEVQSQQKGVIYFNARHLS